MRTDSSTSIAMEGSERTQVLPEQAGRQLAADQRSDKNSQQGTLQKIQSLRFESGPSNKDILTLQINSP